jgi:general secretion pathway protein H
MRASSKTGFTLIEMMVVLVIIGGVAVLGMPYLSNRNSQVQAFLREFTVLSREIHTRAKLNGVAYRLVIDLGEPGSGREHPQQAYWVERSSGKVVLSEKDEEEAMSRAKGSDESKKKDPKGFEPDTQFFKRKKALPPGLRFDRVELTRLKSPLSQGKAFIHYLPQGLVDEAALHIKGAKEQAWTIAIHPLTGKAEVIAKKVDLREIREQ